MALETFFARIYNWNELNDITKAQRPGSRKWEMTAAESNIAWKIDSPIQPSVPVMIYCLPSHVNVVCQLDSNQYTVHYIAKFFIFYGESPFQFNHDVVCRGPYDLSFYEAGVWGWLEAKKPLGNFCLTNLVAELTFKTRSGRRLYWLLSLDCDEKFAVQSAHIKE